MTLNPRRIVRGHPRTFAALAIIAAAFIALPSSMGLQTRALVAWDVGVIAFLAMMLWLFATQPADALPALTEAQDEGQYTIFWVCLLGAMASFAALTSEFTGIKDLPAATRGLHLGIVVITLLGSWFLTHVVFALRYAHAYNDRLPDGRVQGGLVFPGSDAPDYLDFLYFSVVVGMTFQVSDVQIEDRRLRRLVLLHGLLSFLFNTVIVALTVNIAAELL